MFFAKPLGRLKRSLSRHGFSGTAALALMHAGRPLRRGITSIRERSFDMRYGIDTRGIVRHGEPGTFRDAVHYQGTSPQQFRDIVARLGVAPQHLTFLDIGCGKGRALVLAGEIGFQRIVGIEVSERLARIARANLRVRGIDGDVQTRDATGTEFPDGPLLVYLYNPFGESTLRVVLGRLQASLHARPRLVFVVYVNPVHRDLLLGVDDFAAAAQGRDWIAVRAYHPGAART